jgi:hypothetical protein
MFYGNCGGLERSGAGRILLMRACAAVLAAGRRAAPTFLGYVQSPPAPVAVAADLLASAADQNLTSWRSGPAAAAVEHQTLRWLGEFVGFDPAATGILVSGGSAANLTALLVAVRAVTGPDDDRRAMRVYASTDTHFSVAKAAAALGVGFESVAVDGNRRLDPAALRTAIASDRAAGLVPVCVVANAGTTSTGAVDPLDAVAAVAADAGVWLHVDGAYGRRLRQTPLPAGSSAVCTAPTPCASMPTSGCTPRSTAARCCCTTRRPRRGRSAPVPTTTCASSPPSRQRPSRSGSTASSSAAASGR